MPPPLELSPPDPEWPARFRSARAELLDLLGPTALRIEHVGSTAVPGLLAKPTVDVLVVVADTGDVLDRVDALAAAGFEHRPDAWPDPARHVFLRRVVDGSRNEHVHVVPEGSPEIDDYVLLRDHLRARPDEAGAYAAHKVELERAVGGDRAAYVAAKPVYVEELLVRVRAEQEVLRVRVVEIALSNPVLADVLERAARLDLPGWILTGGCLFQTVWNVLDGHEPTRGIADYDLFYFDDADLSWEAEDAAIRTAATAFESCDGEVEVRNEARVHLWYGEKFGTSPRPFRSAEDAIDHFAATTCCVGITRRGGRTAVHAPFGLHDLFEQRLRPNPVLAPREVYEAKAARWTELWPRLEVLPWPVDAAP